MKKVVTIGLVAATLLTGGVVAANKPVAADDRGVQTKDIVGVWEVDAAAPYRPHLFSFHEDGTMSTTNPTNVQESAGAPHGGTNDSVGMGVWKLTKEHDQLFVVGTFEQLNAFADDHQAADKLSVSFKVRLSDSGMSFDGPASAKVGADTLPSHLAGTRLKLDQAAVNALP